MKTMLLAAVFGCSLAVAAIVVRPLSATQVDTDARDTPSAVEFLLEQLARITPPERIRELATYSERQSELGGGFYGVLPDQLADADSIPVPSDERSRREAALVLLRQRRDNLEAMERVSPDYPVTFRGESLGRFLSRLSNPLSTPSETIEHVRLHLDTSALDGFFAALSDGEISEAEAMALAELPSNQAMLSHRRNLGYVPEPLPDTESLAEMIGMAGSRDPLDRLWCWINPQNAFGYADLVQNADAYTDFLSDIDNLRAPLANAVLSHIDRYLPAGGDYDVTFAFTVGWAIQGWATPEMAGLNVEQVKDDLDRLFGTLAEETYHRLQLQFCATPGGAPAREFTDLVTIDTGQARYDRLYEILTYTMLEGCANLARGRFASPDLAEQTPAGVELLARFVDEVVAQGQAENADALISQGLKGNGPLYGLGWTLASLIADRDGPQAVAAYQERGAVAFFGRAAEVSRENSRPLLPEDVVAAIDALDAHLRR